MPNNDSDYSRRAAFEKMAQEASEQIQKQVFNPSLYTFSIRGVELRPSVPMSPEERFKMELRNRDNKIDQLQSELTQRDAFIKDLGESAFVVGIVASIEKDRAMVRVGGMMLDSKVPPKGCKVGDYVRVVQPSNQIHSVVEDAPRVGAVASVTSINGRTIEVNASGQARSVVVTPHVGELKQGDAVIIDETGYFAVTRGVADSQTLMFEASTGISWEDIGGLHDAKEAIREAIEYPIRYAELYRGYGKAPSKGVLLYGPPGCGKTMVGKATATAIRDAHGSMFPGAFLYVKGPELLDKYVGATEDAIRGLFEKARRYKAKTGHAAVLFIDEADALLGRRGGRSLGGMETTVVPAFLAEMDGLEDSGAFVMLSTNRSEDLDSAIVRDGRIDRKILVGRPDKTSAINILNLALKGRPTVEDFDPAALVTVCAEMFSDDALVMDVGKFEESTEHVRLLLRHVLSGAVITGIANRATERAIRRDREEDRSEPSGITTDDLLVSVHAAARELAKTDVRQEVYDLVVSAVGHAAAAKTLNTKSAEMN